MNASTNRQQAEFAAPGEASQAPDSREHQRHLTIMRVAKFVCDGREGLGVVRNISAGGMRIDVYRPIAIGHPLTVSLTDGHHLEATVIWRQDETIGIMFDREASIEELLAIPINARRGQAARPPRVTVGHSALLHWGSAAPAKVEIADLSQRGAKIVSSASLTPNNDVLLELVGLPPLAATIRWVRPGEAGLAFHKALPVKNLMQWLSASMPAR